MILAHYLKPAQNSTISFKDKYPADFLNHPRTNSLWAWHLVGGKDPIDNYELTGTEPNDGYPVILTDLDQARWINDNIVDIYRNSDGFEHGFLYEGADYISFDFPWEPSNDYIVAGIYVILQDGMVISTDRARDFYTMVLNGLLSIFRVLQKHL